MKAVAISIAVIVLVGAVTGMSLMYAQRQATEPPGNSPSVYIATRSSQPQAKLVVLAGDSLTRGSVCASYAEALEAKLDEAAPERYEIVNAGINAEFAYNVAIRVDEVIDCDPDIVVVLIGTNDANAVMMTPEDLARRMEEQSLPRVPDAEWYEHNLGIIVMRLQAETGAAIALVSLPTIGEDPAHPAYRLSGEYSRIVERTAEAYGVTCLPFFESMDGYLDKNPGNPKREYAETRALMMKAILQRYIFRLSWNRIGERNGFVLHTDFLHLNDTGADMLAEQVAAFVTGASK